MTPLFLNVIFKLFDKFNNAKVAPEKPVFIYYAQICQHYSQNLPKNTKIYVCYIRKLKMQKNVETKFYFKILDVMFVNMLYIKLYPITGMYRT